MPWKEVDKMSLKQEFVNLALEKNSNITELCKRYEISRRIGYELIKRYKQNSLNGLEERSRKPKRSPNKTSKEMEDLVLRVRDENWSWGGRKIHKCLAKQGYIEIPHPNTITDILRRHGRINEWRKDDPKQAYIRFEREKPNDLWQMDFKGQFPLIAEYCHPLTILDDHSRFSIALEACANEKTETVKEKLIMAFKRYGLPWQINVDNGHPWGEPSAKFYTRLAVWIMRQGIEITYSGFYHPETNGKDERFHRTLKEEILNRYTLHTLKDCKEKFAQWRDKYNNERPHEALNYEVPARRYQVSNRKYKEQLARIEYLKDDKVRVVHKDNCCIIFKGKQIRIGSAFSGEPVAIRETEEGIYSIFYCQQKIKEVNLRGSATGGTPGSRVDKGENPEEENKT